MARGDIIMPVQGLRFVAALAVALSHAEISAYWTAQQLGYAAERWLFPGAAGVDVFFVISGFVMVHAMRGRFGVPRARVTFLKRRLIRIVPPYWLALTGLVVWGLFYPPFFDAPTLVTSYLFIPYPALAANGRVVPYLEPGWTLNLEIMFYLLFAACLAVSAGKTVLRVGAVLLALVALHGLIDPAHFALAFWTQPVITEFCFGMVLGLLHGRFELPPLLAASLAAAGLAAIALSPALSGHPAGEWARVVWYGLPGAAIVAGAALSRWDVPWPRVWDEAGNLSYALYLWHMPALYFTARAHGHFGIPVHGASFAALGIALSLIAAAVSHYLAERPLSAWLRKRLGLGGDTGQAGHRA